MRPDPRSKLPTTTRIVGANVHFLVDDELQCEVDAHQPHYRARALQALEDRIADAEDKWAAFVSVALDCIILVRGGIVSRQHAGETLRSWSLRFFEIDKPDDNTRAAWLCDAVVRAFASATKPATPKVDKAA